MSVINPNGLPPLIRSLDYLLAEQVKNIDNSAVANGTLALDYNSDGKFDQVDEFFVRQQADLTPPGSAQDKFINQLYMVRSILRGVNQFESKSDQEQEQIAITLFDYNGDKALDEEDLLFKQAEYQQTGSAKAWAEVELLKFMKIDEPAGSPIVTVAISSLEGVQEDTKDALLFTFSRTGSTTAALTVNYTLGGTATLGTDYTGIASKRSTKTVNFAAGASTAIVTVVPKVDGDIEADETVSLTLASGTGYVIGTTEAVTGTILNDDATVTLAVSPAAVTEDGTANLLFTFTRVGAITSALKVNYTVGGTATLGADYTGIAAKRSTKTVSFAAGASTATVTVNPTADSTTEEDETVTLTLASGTGYTIVTMAPVSGTISNDDFRLPLYNPTTVTLPSQQGWLSFGSGLTGTQILSSGGTTLTSTALMADMAGYSNHTVAAAQPVNSAFPALDRQTGVSLDFRVRLINENHQDSTRAGFSVTLLDQSATPLGIELGFWTNSIFSQNGGSTPFQTPLERVDGLNTTMATDYSLRLIDQTYFLLANNRLVLSGAVQDYSQWHKNPLLPYNPYTTPNFLFLGDNTSRASASVELGTTTLALATRLSEGNDSLTATSAAETLNGLGGNDRLNGEDGNDWLIGGVGIDQLNGGKGDDVLFGGADVDRFQFSTSATFHTADLGVDTIVDFNPLQDRLRLSRMTFSALPAGSTLEAAAFEVVTLDDAAASSAALIVYNSLNGRLFYNPNGSDAGFASSIPAGGQFAQLWSGTSGGPFPALANTMIEVF